MPNASSTDPAKFDFSTFSPWVAAIVAAGGAFALFEGKLERMRALRNETGRWEAGFIGFYVVPQWGLMILSCAIVIFLGIACIDVINPTAMSGFPFIAFARAAFEIHNIAWTMAGAAVLAIMVRWNWIPRLLLLLARGASALPLPWISHRFGPQGESVGWHQAKAVCEGPDKGAPLLIKEEDLDRVARIVLTRLSQPGAASGGDANYADIPKNLTPDVKANMALFGCIMEANYATNRWKRPDWKAFYASLTDMQAAKPIFGPADLKSYADGNAFFADFRQRLEDALTKNNVEAPPNQSLDAAGDIVRAWDLLKKRGDASVLKLPPWYADFLGGRIAWLDRRLRAFPRMNSDGMRPQLLKLMTRWGSIARTDGLFIQPFAKTIAWLLLQEGALVALPETKDVTFNSFGQAPISRLAMKRVLQRVAALIGEGSSAEARTVAKAVGDSEWRRFEIGDFVLWSWSNDAKKEAAGAPGKTTTPWDKATWKWKFDEDRVVRQS